MVTTLQGSGHKYYSSCAADFRSQYADLVAVQFSMTYARGPHRRRQYAMLAEFYHFSSWVNIHLKYTYYLHGIYELNTESGPLCVSLYSGYAIFNNH